MPCRHRGKKVSLKFFKLSIKLSKYIMSTFTKISTCHKYVHKLQNDKKLYNYTNQTKFSYIILTNFITTYQ